ncbi:MAG: MerR family transcriptional regulator [Actinomycetota bacterium]
MKGKEKERERRMTISELAAEFGIAPSAIRYYEEMGLLSPRRNSSRGQRFYGDRERARLKLILRGRRFGYSLSEIADILELYDADPTQARQIMRTLEYGFRHIREMDERIEELLEIRGEMLEFARNFLKILEEGEEREAKTFAGLAREVIRELEAREFSVRSRGVEETLSGVKGVGRSESRGGSGKKGRAKTSPPIMLQERKSAAGVKDESR